MNVIILGSGALGRHLAAQLAQENHNVTVIDKDPERLSIAADDGDVGTKEGFATDWKLLEELLDLEPDIFIALTGDDATNLVACSLAKNLGYPETIARVRDCDHASASRLDFGRLFYLDHLLDPDLLVAQEIFKTFVNQDFVAVENFAHGSVQLRTMIIPEKWKYANKKLKDLPLPEGVMIGLICRGKHTSGEKKPKIIFPHGEDSILPKDEVSFIGDVRSILQIHQFIGLTLKPMKDVVIIGGSKCAAHLSKILLERGVDVKLIEKDYKVCTNFAERFPMATVLHKDATKLDFLKSERVDKADALVTCTAADDVNLLVAILAKEIGCTNITVGVSDTSYTPIIERLGMAHVLSSRGIAVNRVRAILKNERVTSMTSLYDNQAQILEVKVSSKSRLIGVPLSELGPYFPKDFLVSVIHNQGRVVIADGKQTFSPGDTVITISNPKHLQDVSRFF